MTAGTILHASKLPLTVWFWAAYLMATHSNGISALQLQKQLGIGSYRSAWLLAHKLRASMVDPERNPLSGLVEIDEASLPFRTKDDPPTGGQGRSHDGKMLIVGAIELGDGNIPGRLRLAEISSYGAADLGHFVETAADPDAIAKTDGWSGYAAVPADRHNVQSSGRPPLTSSCRGSTKSSPTSKDGRERLPGLRRKHLQAYLDEFVFRFNRRKTRRSLFRLATNGTPYLQHVDRTGAMCISGPDGALFHGPRARPLHAHGEPIVQPGRPRETLRRNPPAPCGRGQPLRAGRQGRTADQLVRRDFVILD